MISRTAATVAIQTPRLTSMTGPGSGAERAGTVICEPPDSRVRRVPEVSSARERTDETG